MDKDSLLELEENLLIRSKSYFDEEEFAEHLNRNLQNESEIHYEEDETGRNFDVLWEDDKIVKIFLKRILKQLPECIGKFKNLRGLYISKCWLMTLPESIGELNNLRELNVKNNVLETLPTSIGKLKNLISLDLRDNNLKSLPENLSDLKNLNDLKISDQKKSPNINS